MQIIEKIKSKQEDLWGKPSVTIAFLGDSVTQGCFDVYWEKTHVQTVFNQQDGYHSYLAKLLAKDYMRMDKERDFEIIGELDLGVDYAMAYIGDIHMEKVILVHGNKVLSGTFHEYSGEKDNYFTLEEWAQIMADSIK